MRHNWIIEVLEDLRAYAALNDLSATVVKVDDALRIAKAEVKMGHEPMQRAVTIPPGMIKLPN